MPVPTTNVTLSSLQTEYGGVNPILMSEYYRGAGGGYVPLAQTSTNGTIPTTGAITMGVFRGTTKVVSAAFTPPGGASAGTAVLLEDVQSTDAAVSISCTQNATWTYSGGGAGSSVSIVSGGVNTIITFYLTTDFNPRNVSFIVSATAGGVTQYWEVYLEVQGFA
jgi:hypothetical protein